MNGMAAHTQAKSLNSDLVLWSEQLAKTKIDLRPQFGRFDHSPFALERLSYWTLRSDGKIPPTRCEKLRRKRD